MLFQWPNRQNLLWPTLLRIPSFATMYSSLYRITHIELYSSPCPPLFEDTFAFNMLKGQSGEIFAPFI
jgi:hypothetical protein